MRIFLVTDLDEAGVVIDTVCVTLSIFTYDFWEMYRAVERSSGKRMKSVEIKILSLLLSFTILKWEVVDHYK